MRSLSLLPTPTHDTREMLADTAAAAVGGGTVVGLVPLAAAGRWHATVLTADGIKDVRLDTVLASAVVVPRPDELAGDRAA